jgi:hypothetical protein
MNSYSRSLNPMTNALNAVASKYNGTTQGIPDRTLPNGNVTMNSINQATSTPQPTHNVSTTITHKINPVTPAPTQSGMINQSTQPTTPAPVTPAQPTTPTPPAPINYGSAAQGLWNTAQKPTQQYTDLTNQAEDAYKQAANFGQKVGQNISAVEHNPEYSQDTGQGLGGMIAQNQGLKMTALNNTAAGLGNLANTANTQQGLQQSGQYNAAGLLAPTQVSYSNQYLNPVTGQPVNPQASQDMQNAVNLQIQKLQGGKTDPDSAKAALSNYGQAGINALEQGMGASFNPNLSSAEQKTAVDLTNQKNQLQSVFNGVDQNYQLLLNTAKQGGVNKGDVPALNQLQQNFQKGLASKDAVIDFQNTLSTVRAGYAQILGGGTATVDSNDRAEQAIPNSISLDALTSLGEQLKSESVNRIGGIDQQINTLTNKGKQSQTTTSGGGSLNSSSGGSIYNF